MRSNWEKYHTDTSRESRYVDQQVKANERVQSAERAATYAEPTEQYQPKPVDVGFAQTLTGLMKDGGVWGWPDSGLVYRFDKANKQLVLTNVVLSKHQQRMNDRTKAVFGAIGWSVVHQPEVS